jgi:hypothetical protein
MKVPANLPADRLILEYLSRVAAAGNRMLPKGKRMAFVSATRNRIWREIGPSGTADADRVREVLAGLGEPEDLVRAERARMDAETADRLERQAQKKEAAEAAAAAAAPPGTAPLQYRPRTPRPGPAGPASPRRGQPSDGRGDATAPERRPGRRGAPGEGKPRRRLGGLLADWQNRLGAHPAQPSRPSQPSQPGEQPPPETVTGSPAGPGGQGPESTSGPAPQSTAGQAPAATGGQGPGTAPGRAPGKPANQTPEGTGGQDPRVTGGQGPGTASGPGPSRLAHWIPGFGDPQAPGGTDAPTTNAPGGTDAPTTNGARPHGANGAAPAAAGAHQNGGTVPAGVGPSAEGEEETSALSRGTHALRGAAVTLGNRAVDLGLDTADLARQHKLETAAVLLLGVSAFIFVFPFWLVAALVGGVVAISSQIWNLRDKWVGLAGPPVIALVGTIVAALIIGGRGHFVGSVPEAFRLYVGYCYRGGSLLCAIYLALQARRGPQRRLPAWRR